MKVEIKDGVLFIAIPVTEGYPLSKSGKSRMVATSEGIIKTDVKVDGKVLSIGLNAFIPA